MSDDRNDLPPVNSPNFLEKVREALSTYLGNRGSRLDRGLTVRDLFDAGLIDITPGYLSNKGRISPVGGIGSSVESTYEIDLTPPPIPTGFTAAAAISNLLIECGTPTYTQGHGHARSILYGASWISGSLPVFSDAVVLTEFIGTVASYATNPATTWHLWLKWKTVDGVLSITPAGGTNGIMIRTGEDVALLLEALTGEITEGQLYSALGSRIDLIDGGEAQPALPYPLVKIAALQDGLNQRVRTDLDAAGVGLLESIATISTTLETFRDAGVYVDPADGVVKISGIEAANDHLTTVDIRLSAAEGGINLKASTAYVDGAIAAAVLGQADLALFSGVDLRLTTAEVDISSLEGAVTLKASDANLSAANVRITTAESDINALEGQIAMRVTSANFDSVTGGLDARVGNAETVLSVIGDASAITSMVQQGNTRYRDDAADAETLLRSILNNETTADVAKQTLAVARMDLTAYTDAGVAAEASQRLLLAAAIGANAASLEDEKTVRASADSAESSARLALAAVVNDPATGLGSKSSITQVAAAKAEAISAAASVTDTISARLNGGDFAAVQVQSSASASAVTGLLAQYTVKLDVGGKVSGYGLASSATSSEFAIRADRFYIAPPETGGGSATQIIPFTVQATETTINGVPVPAGVYMDGAFIKDLTAPIARLGSAWIDDAKISSMSAAKITAGSLKVGSYIESADYTSGPDGVGYRIDRDSIILPSTTIRGKLTTSQIQVGAATSIQDQGYTARIFYPLSTDTSGTISSLADLTIISSGAPLWVFSTVNIDIGCSVSAVTRFSVIVGVSGAGKSFGGVQLYVPRSGYETALTQTLIGLSKTLINGDSVPIIFEIHVFPENSSGSAVAFGPDAYIGVNGSCFTLESKV